MVNRRPIKRGEALAILSESIHTGPSAMWWDFYDGPPANDRCGSVEVVHVRGSLDHHVGACDSYEAILARVDAAFVGLGRDDDGDYTVDRGEPSAVVLRIDSPGGVCSGLNETVFALRRMAMAAGIPLIAYVDELAASAAYALACACSEIILPPSAIAGSIGVISGMYDQTAADEKMGVRFVTLKSGARKDDGHPHVPLSDAALNAEQRRVDRLAKQFFAIVASARPLTAAEVEGYQAGIFLGKEVVTKGLADALMGWDEMIDALSEMGAEKKPLAKVGQAESGVVSPRAPLGAKGESMSLVALNALVKRATAAVASEKDPEKKKALSATLATYTASLEAYKKEKHSIEKTETEEGDDDPDDKDDDEGDDDAEESAESAESEESAESADDEEKEKKAAKAILGPAATAGAIDKLATIVRKANAYDTTRKDVRSLKATAIASAKNSLIDEALGLGGKPIRITPAEAIQLRGSTTAEVKFFLNMRKGAIINTQDGGVHIPDPSAKPGAGLSAEVTKQIDAAVFAAPEGVDRLKLRADMVAKHEKRMSDGLNGAGGRY